MKIDVRAIKSRLNHLDLRRVDLANYLGISRSTLQRSLAGNRSFSVAEVRGIAHYLGCSPIDIMSSLDWSMFATDDLRQCLSVLLTADNVEVVVALVGVLVDKQELESSDINGG